MGNFSPKGRTGWSETYRQARHRAYTLLLGGLLLAIAITLGSSVLGSWSTGQQIQAQETTTAPQVVDGAVNKARGDAHQLGSKTEGNKRGSAVVDTAVDHVKKSAHGKADKPAEHGAGHGGAPNTNGEPHGEEAHGDGGHGGGGGHADPVAPILIVLFVILLAAKLGGDLFERLNQPSVLGELVFGLVGWG